MTERFHAEHRAAEMAAAIAANDPARVQALMLVYGMRLGQLEDENEQRLEKDRVRSRNRRRSREQLELMAPLALLPGGHQAGHVEANRPRKSADFQDASADAAPFAPHPRNPLLTTTARTREGTATAEPAAPDDAAPPTLSEQLTAVVNRGLRKKFGPETGLVHVDAVAIDLAAFVASSGVEEGRVFRELERKAERCHTHPRRMAYFGPVVRDFIGKELGRRRIDAAAAVIPAHANAPARPVITPAQHAALRAEREASLLEQFEQRGATAAERAS